MQISKEYNNIIRACAIISIALHNLLHTQEMGFAQENEMTFNANRSNHFFDLFIYPDLSIIGDMVSFIGWAGVPVFVFLSGYGLAKKYQQRNLKFIQHVKKSYIKLLLLMLPAAFIVITPLIFTGQYKSVIEKLLALTMLNNLIPTTIASISPVLPPYWYFSLTMQLYILFALYHFCKYKKLFIFWGIIIPLILMALLSDTPDLLNYVRRNFIGWTPLFCIGMYFASHANVEFENKKVLPVIAIASLCLMYIMNVNYYLWLVMPFSALSFFLSMASIIESNYYLKPIFNYIGKFSTYIFVSHHFGILICNEYLQGLDKLIIIFLYIGIVISLAYCYKSVHSLIVKHLITE